MRDQRHALLPCAHGGADLGCCRCRDATGGFAFLAAGLAPLRADLGVALGALAIFFAARPFAVLKGREAAY